MAQVDKLNGEMTVLAISENKKQKVRLVIENGLAHVFINDKEIKNVVGFNAELFEGNTPTVSISIYTPNLEVAGDETVNVKTYYED